MTMKNKKQQSSRSLHSTASIFVMALVLSACSGSGVKLDAVDDNVAYRGSKSVRALAIPPGLDKPDFDPTYAKSKSEEPPPNSRRVEIVTASNGKKVIATNEAPRAAWKRLKDVFPKVDLQLKGEDSDKGVYTTVYTGDSGMLPRRGWLNRALGLEKEADIREDDAVYEVKIGRSSNGITAIVVEPGKNGNAAEAVKILNKLATELEG